MNASHRHTFDMIPWLVNGRVDDDERRALDEHLRDCAECRVEFAEQQRVRSAMCAEQSRVDYAAGASLQKLWSRIGTGENISAPVEKSTSVSGAGRGTRHRVMQWLVAAVVVEAIGITMLAAASVNKPTTASVLTAQPDYRTVTTTKIVATSPALRVVFAPNFTVTEMNALLREQRLEIVNGPSAVGAYTLGTTDSVTESQSNLSQVLSNLRLHHGVQLAEPIARTSESKP